jgi:proline iminopeptidase
LQQIKRSSVNVSKVMHMKYLKIRFLRASIILLAIVLVVGSLPAQTKSNLTDGEGFVNNDGLKIWYKVDGARGTNTTPLLMIHGGPGATARPFEKTIGPVLAKSRPVIYMDYRGTGRSDRPKDLKKYSFTILASDAEVLHKHLGIGKWAVFGHSNGGATALTYARRDSNHVAAIILCDPLLSPADLEMNTALAPADKYEQARAIYKSGAGEEERFGRLLDLLDQKTRDSFQFYDPVNSSRYGRIQNELSKEIGKGLMELALIQGLIASGFFQFDAFKSAAQVTMPTLLLLGRYDSEISIDNSMKFALAAPDGYVAVMNRSGHHPYLEETIASGEKIDAFLSAHVDNRKHGK